MKGPRKISIKAILIGALVELAGTIIGRQIFRFIVVFIFASQGIPETEMESKLSSSPMFSVGSLIIGFGFVFFSGFIGARIAKFREILHASIIGVISVLSSLTTIPFTPLWFDIIVFLLTIPIAMFGGYIAKCERY